MCTLMQVCVETMMHLTCTNMPVSELENALDKVAPCTYSVSCLAFLPIPQNAACSSSGRMQGRHLCCAGPGQMLSDTLRSITP